ncbi:MAG TPA: hypothetical protein VHE30_11350 [Polyangiaceae bacterium]|nr:hypothetical protein [Polyangiaceae bacterium]
MIGAGVPLSAPRLLTGFFDEGGEAALVAAVREVEALSSAEVVVSVRKSSGSYADASLVVGAAGAGAALAFGLFSPWPFSHASLLVDPFLIGAVLAWGSRLVPSLRRLATSPSERARRVATHARAQFVERGVGNTSGRTGVLVYVSLLERAAFVVADTGVTSAVPAEEWSARVAELDAAARRGKATAVARAVTALGPTLARPLPRSDDDVNELPDRISSA